MKNYVPFLKAKSNEFSSLKNLELQIANTIIPFFDIPRKNNVTYTENDYCKLVDRIRRKITLNLGCISCFYMDDYDIDDSLYVSGFPSYRYVMDMLGEYMYIPVIGIDRSDERNEVVLNNSYGVKTNTVAIRINVNDIQPGFADLNDLVNKASEKYKNVELVIDMRVIGKNDSSDKIYDSVYNFLVKNTNNYSKIIVTGSSIPNSSGSIVAPNKSVDLERKEIEIERRLNLVFPNLFFGDYTIISPNYSDISIDPRIIPNIMTARVVYSYSDRHYIIRGSSIKTGGYYQFKEFCNHITKQSFFRGSNYSYGDAFIQNSQNMSKKITAASIINPTVNSHISYMYKDFSF